MGAAGRRWPGLRLCLKNRTPRRRVTELRGGPVVHGLILLAFLAALVVVIAVRLRRKLGLATHPRPWVVVFGVFVVVLLVLWGQAQH